MRFFMGALIFCTLALSTSGIADDPRPKIPFRELRNVSSPQVRAWVDGQNHFTKNFLADQKPIEAQIRARFKELTPSNPPLRMDTPVGELWLNSKGELVLSQQNHADEILVGPPTTPMNTVISAFQVSADFKKILFSEVTGGSDIAHWSVYDLERRAKLSDEPVRIRYGQISWDVQGLGFYYSVWPSAKIEEELIRKHLPRKVPTAYHKLGTSPKDDVLIFDVPEKRQSTLYSIEELVPGAKLLAHRFFGPDSPMGLFLGEKIGRNFRWTPIRYPGKIRGRLVTRVGNEAILVSTELGNNYGLVAIELSTPFKVRTLVPPMKTEVLNHVQRAGDYLVGQYFNVSTFKVTLRTFDLSGKLILSFRPSDIGLPDLATVSPLSATSSSKKAYFTYSAMGLMPITLVYDLRSLKVSKVPSSAPNSLGSVNPVQVDVRFYRSGTTLVPIHIFSRKGSTRPAKFAHLYYYGAISNKVFSSFNKNWMITLEMGGIVAVANVRGGGERGLDWFLAGASDRMVTINDIGAAARWLKANYAIEQNRVIAEGRSYGGMHTYMTLQNFPNEFSAFISWVPLSNVPYAYNSHFGWLLFDDWVFERDQFGNLKNIQSRMNKIQKWSPLQNIDQMQMIKPILTLGAVNDQRAGAEQAYFMTHALQHRFGPLAPVYMLEASGGGHYTTSGLIESLVFAAKEMGIKELIKPIR